MGLFSFLGNMAQGVGNFLGKIPIVGGIAQTVGKVAGKAASFVGHVFGERGNQTSHAIKQGLQKAQDTYQRVGKVGEAISNIPILGDQAKRLYQESGLRSA